MMNTIKKYACILALALTSLTATEASANETMFKLFISAQDFTEYQEELALNLVKEGKKLAEQVKEPKHELKDFAKGLVDIEALDVDVMMQSYKTWQAKVDAQMLVTMKALAALHAELTPEQKQKLINAIGKKS